MDIKVRFDLSYLEQELKSLDDKVINKLVQTGEAAIQKAVKSGQYVNRTGNLRSSIGYVLAYNGKVIREGSRKLRGSDLTCKELGLPPRRVRMSISGLMGLAEMERWVAKRDVS